MGVLTSSNAAKDRHRISVTGGERYIHNERDASIDQYCVDVFGRGTGQEEAPDISAAARKAMAMRRNDGRRR